MPDQYDALAQRFGGALKPVPAHQPATPAPALAPGQRGWADVTDIALDTALGAAKGVGRTAVGLGRLASAVPGIHQISEAIQPGAFAPGVAEEGLGLNPTSTPQRVGMTAEQIGEYFLPASKVNQAATAMMGSGVIPRALAEAAAAFGVAKAQGDPSAGTTAALAGAGPVLGRVAEPLIAKAAGALRASGVADVEHAMNPTTRKMKAKTERIAPEVQRRGIVGSIDEVKDAATGQRKALGEQIDDALLTARDNPVDVRPVRDQALQIKAETENLVRQPDGTSKAVVHDPRKAAQADKMLALLDEYGDSMTTEQAVAVRRTWDDVVSRAGGYDEKASGAFGVTLDDASEAGVVRPLAGRLRKQLAQSNPDVADLNKEFKFWKDLEDVSKATQSRRVGQRGNLVRNVVRAGGMAAGAAVGGPGVGNVAGALLAGETAARAERLFSSPKFKLLSAREKGRLADALSSGDKERIGTALGRATAAISGITPMPAHGS